MRLYFSERQLRDEYADRDREVVNVIERLGRQRCRNERLEEENERLWHWLSDCEEQR